ncbi:MAG: sigma 54-interacting transcriptional regulator [Lachnospiraceae bacterium]
MNFTPLWTAALNAFSNFIIVDEHCRIAYMNKPYTEILNVQLEDVIGKPIKSVIPTTKLPEVMASGKAHIGALMTLYDHKTGKDISFVCNRIPLIEDGEVIGGVAISTFNEVGEIYNLYSEVEKMQQQNELYQQTIEQLRKQTNPLDYIIGTSQAIQQIKSTIAIFANSGLSILLTGETGVGKEVFANALHQLSSRSTSNFVKINCAAIQKDLLESELFGYEGGAFTGAKKGGKIGKFELADGGTLLLDEIGEMPLPLQSKLLRVLQEKEVERIGGVTPSKWMSASSAATNQNPTSRLIQDGRLPRSIPGLSHINTIEPAIPPLRDRLWMTFPTSALFVQKFNRRKRQRYTQGVEQEVLALDAATHHGGQCP